MQMKIFIINLEASKQRKEKMIKEMEKTNLDYNFFTGIDGRKIKNISKIYNQQKPKTLRLGEIGCAMSHLSIYKKMIDENIEKAFILEDDVKIDPCFNNVFEKLKKIKFKNSIILLGQSDKNIKKKVYYKKITETHKIKRIFNSGYGAFGYIIDIKAAKKLYSFNYPVRYASDWWSIYSKFINIYIVEPNIVHFTREFASIIDSIEKRNNELNTKKLSVFDLPYIFCRKSFSLLKKIFRLLKNTILQVIPSKKLK